MPPQVIVPRGVEDLETLAEALTERRRRPVEVRHAERGDKRRILELAERNARFALDQDRLRSEHRRSQRIEALDGLQQALGMDTIPMRIECFDISNLMGDHTVASMVVFEGGAPKKSDYRRFGIRGVGAGRLRRDGRGAVAPHGPVRGPARAIAARSGLRRELCLRAGADRDRRGQGAAVRRPGRAGPVPGPGRDRGEPGQAHRGGLHPRPAGRRSCCRTTRPSCSCSSASATRRTASRSSSTAAAATRR